jgi:hypothetical protein
VVTVFGPVIVKLDPDTRVNATPPAATAAVFPIGLPVQKYVDVDVNAGEIPVTVAVDGEAELKATLP